MSYQVLARKWRPKSFREMAGQAHVLKALINALDHDRLHHAYLFTGTRGVGKTTIARILAKCLNCETGVSSEPCGTCDACVSINEGRFVDLIEVDAASKTKVDDTRELLDNVQYTPTRGRYKVYLIDEVHMLSGHSFNALLKTLEEPPPHVKFLLATTDPQKIPATILSRCLQFSLKNMTPEKIVEHLQFILGQEMVSYDEEALWRIANAAEGSMRDALSITDQAIAFGAGKLVLEEVERMLGSIDQGSLHELLNNLQAGDAAAVIATVRNLANHGVDCSAVLVNLLSLLHRVALTQVLPDVIDNSMNDREAVLRLAAEMPAEDVQFYYQMGLSGRRDLPLAPDSRSGLEMVLLRMLAFKPAGVHHIPDAGSTPGKKSLKPESAPEQAVAPARLVTGSAQELKPVAATAVTERLESVPSLGASGPPASETRMENAAKLAENTHTRTVFGLRELDNDLWCREFDSFGFAGLLRSIVMHCVFIKSDDQRLYFHIAPENANMLNESNKERFAKALQAYFNCAITLDLQLVSVSLETPAAYAHRLQAENLAAMKDRLYADPMVRLLVAEFNAELDENSIRALEARSPQEHH